MLHLIWSTTMTISVQHCVCGWGGTWSQKLATLPNYLTVGDIFITVPTKLHWWEFIKKTHERVSLPNCHKKLFQHRYKLECLMHRPHNRCRDSSSTNHRTRTNRLPRCTMFLLISHNFPKCCLAAYK